MKIEIVPAILSKTPSDYHKKFKAVEPYTDWIQIDIVDNKFARNLTVGPKVIASFRTLKKLEIQLMVDYIEDWVDPFVKIGRKANIRRIVVPCESSRDPLGTIYHIRRHGIEVGFSLNPDTPTSRLQHIIDKLDTVLLLSVYPGFSGQHFVYGVLKKIEELRIMKPDVVIEVDGGIEPGTARKCAEMGANILVSGSFIFENATIEGETYHEKVKKALDTLKQDVQGPAPLN
ncbi:MAG: ribulose-phosphate 3-epimerase [bacterium]|nr:ribulose-phosphate 3-epimerase [bacterium]